jgi:hypothetical protein
VSRRRLSLLGVSAVVSVVFLQQVSKDGVLAALLIGALQQSAAGTHTGRQA